MSWVIIRDSDNIVVDHRSTEPSSLPPGRIAMEVNPTPNFNPPISTHAWEYIADSFSDSFGEQFSLMGSFFVEDSAVEVVNQAQTTSRTFIDVICMDVILKRPMEVLLMWSAEVTNSTNVLLPTGVRVAFDDGERIVGNATPNALEDNFDNFSGFFAGTIGEDVKKIQLQMRRTSLASGTARMRRARLFLKTLSI
jgi:hypothetical protein